MRHHVRTRKFTRTGSHRKALFRNLVTSFLKHGHLETTLAKAKELRIWAEKMITLGKRGDLHARRQALAVITEESVVKRLFTDIAAVCKDRPGGYTRVTKLGNRHGDAAPMALLELTDLAALPKAKPGPKKEAAKKGPEKKGGEKKAAEEKPAKKKAAEKKAPSKKAAPKKAPASKAAPEKKSGKKGSAPAAKKGAK